ncbi:Relaxin receptor 2 [Trichoplax sp. H2]|nr:Relaxin receptor 2 [Trichoplax sp. H2]RDD47651.1 Relaxin receptor 2 [Trichoplax sp. H2]|eukprot:RDD39022.1 Relaxin receptor 2 [Trichoplax sp. H2]
MIMSYSLFQGNDFARYFCWIFAIIGIFGNAYIIISCCTKKISKIAPKKNSTHQSNSISEKSTKVTHLLVCQLAIADLLGCLYLLIIACADIYYSYQYPAIYQVHQPKNFTNIWVLSPFCYIAKYCFFTSSIASISITLLITFDRFMAVIFPYSRFRLDKYKCYFIIPTLWCLLCCYGCIPLVIGTKAIDQATKTFNFASNLCIYKQNTSGYKLFLYFRVGIYFTFCTLITLGYICIIINVRAKSSKVSTQINRIERRILAMMIIITASNIASLLPSTILFTSPDFKKFSSYRSFEQNRSSEINGTSGRNGLMDGNELLDWIGLPNTNKSFTLNATSGWHLLSRTNESSSWNGKQGLNNSTRWNILSRSNNFNNLTRTKEGSKSHESSSQMQQLKGWYQISLALVSATVFTFVNAAINPVIFAYFSWSTSHRKWFCCNINLSSKQNVMNAIWSKHLPYKK